MVKNIIVIGASYAGHNAANALASGLSDEYRVLLVERNEFVLHVPAVVRAVVVPGWEEKNLTARVTQDVVFPAGSRHRVIAPNTVVELKKSSIVLAKPFEGSTEVSFEKCVIATGAQQSEPMRARPGATADEYKATLRRMQAEIKAATKILIVGGGAVGIEVAGEIASAYPEKSLTIVHNDAGLLHPTPSAPSSPGGVATYVPAPTVPKLGDSLAKQLRARGAQILLDDRAILDGKTGALGKVESIPLKSGNFVQADYVFSSIGNKPNSEIVRAADPDALTSNDYVIVDDLFRVVPGSASSPLAGEYYALGDVASVNAWKTCVSAVAEAEVLGANILLDLKGRQAKKYAPNPEGPMVVTVGPTGGAGTMPLPYFGYRVSFPSFVIGMKSKDFFAGKVFYSRFHGSEKVPITA